MAPEVSKRKAARRNTPKDRGYTGIGNGAEFATSYLSKLRKDPESVTLAGYLQDVCVFTKGGTPEDEEKRNAFANVIESALVAALYKGDLINDLGVLFEGLRAHGERVMDALSDPAYADLALVPRLMADRGEALLEQLDEAVTAELVRLKASAEKKGAHHG